MEMMRQDAELIKTIAADGYVSAVLSIPTQADLILVGGFLRDIFLGKKSTDRDFAFAGDIEALLDIITKRMGWKRIAIGRHHLTRLLAGNEVTIDFLPLAGDMDEDLSRRDFTINALAWSPERGIIDLHNGMADIRAGTVRLIRRDNLSRDPVRIIRAYRFAAELCFSIEDGTRRTIRELAPLLSGVAIERITLEFFKILNQTDPRGTLRLMLDDGVLSKLIQLPDNKLHSLLQVLDHVLPNIDNFLFKLRMNPHEAFSVGLFLRGMILLEILLEDRPQSRFALSSRIVKRLDCMDRAYELMKGLRGAVQDRLYDILKAAGGAAGDFLLVHGLMQYTGDLDRFKALQRKGLLSTREIQDVVGAVSGRILGKLIEDLKKAQFERRIGSAREAIDHLRQLTAHGYYLT